MKNKILCLLILVFNQSINAQFTITSDWFPEIGDSYTTSYFYPSQSAKPIDDLNFIWDISNYQKEGQSNFTYENPEDFDYYIDFPNSQLGRKNSFDIEYFYSTQNDTLRFLGSNSVDRKTIYLTNSPIIAFDEFSVGQSVSTSYTIATIFNSTSDTIFDQITEKITFIGIGEVITPIESYDNCAMIKLESSSDVPLYNKTQYSFYQNNLSNLIASYRHTHFNSEPPIVARYKSDPISSSKNVVRSDHIKVYSYEQNKLMINTPYNAQFRIQIFNFDGVEIHNELSNLVVGNNYFSIQNMEEINAYVVFLHDMNNNQFRTFKIINK